MKLRRATTKKETKKLDERTDDDQSEDSEPTTASDFLSFPSNSLADRQLCCMRSFLSLPMSHIMNAKQKCISWILHHYAKCHARDRPRLESLIDRN